MLSERNCYIVTELCREGNLDDRIKTRQPFSDQELSTIIVDLWKGLKYMREKGVTHRDLKPANIFISNGRMKIADFGLAKFYK
jgi:serine/threonine-protein kinase ULK/ATG1